jgi:hypothetical protein
MGTIAYQCEINKVRDVSMRVCGAMVEGFEG